MHTQKLLITTKKIYLLQTMLSSCYKRYCTWARM